MIDLGAKMDSCAQDLVDSGWKPDVVEAADMEDEERLSAVATSGELKQCAERINHGTSIIRVIIYNCGVEGNFYLLR